MTFRFLVRCGVVMAAALLLLSSRVEAQIALQDGAPLVIAESTSTSETVPITVTTGASVLVVEVEDHGATAGSEPLTLSFNGATLTRAIQEDHSQGTTRGSAIYYAFNPPVGNSVNLTVTVPTANDVGLTWFTLNGVNTAIAPTVVGTNSGATATVSSLSVTASVSVGAWAVDNSTYATENAIATVTGTGGTTTTVSDETAQGSTTYAAGYISGLSAGSDTFEVNWNNTGNNTANEKANFGVLIFTPVYGALAIVIPPSSQSVPVGATVTFNATLAPGTTGVTYQWQSGVVGSGVYTNIVNGGQFSGANTNTLVVANVNLADDADYVLQVSNGGGSVTSAPPATLTVIPGAPVINTAPAGAAEPLGWPASLSVTAVNALSYQWQAGVTGSGLYTNLQNGAQFSGVNTSNLVINSFTASESLDYVVVVSNGAGSVTNDGINGDAAPATLTLSTNFLYNPQFALPGTGKIQTGYATIPGWADDFPAAGYNNDGVQQVENPGFINDPNFTSAWEGYADNGQGGAYQLTYCKIKKGDSIVATWYAQQEGGTAGSIQNVGIITATSQSAAITAVTTNASTTNVLNSPYAPYTLVYNSTPADVGNYVGIYYYTYLPGGLTGNSWCGFDDFYLTILPAGAPPVISSTSPSLTAYLGATVDLSVSAGGSGLGYQWLTDYGTGTYAPIQNGGQYSGANSATLVIAGIVATNQGNFECVVSNQGGSATNDGQGIDLPPIALTVSTVAPVINTVTGAGAFYLGQTVNLSETDTGGVTYQWQAGVSGSGIYTNLQNGPQFSGVNTPNLVVTNFAAAESLDYVVVVSNGAGSVTNDGLNGDLGPLILTVNQTLPVIAEQSSSETVYAGQTAYFSVVVSNIYEPTYQWQKNGVNLSNGGTITGATTNLLAISGVSAASQATYTVVVSNPAGPTLSQAVTLTVIPAPAAGTYAAAVLANKPLAYWPLNETSGTIAYDYAGGNNGTYIGNVVLGEPGPNGYFGANDLAPVFDGASAYVDVPEGPFNIFGPLTVSGWVNVTNVTDFSDIVGHGDSSWRIAVFNGSGDPSVSDGGGNDATSAASIASNGWHQVVMTCSGASGVANNGALYVDGVLVANSTWTSTAGNNYDVWIGGAPDYGLGRLLDGNIAQVAVFTTALSANQVQSLYNAGTLGPVTLSIAPAASGNVTITWTGGALLQATNLLGPWVTNTAATSPYTTGATNTRTFFRVQQP